MGKEVQELIRKKCGEVADLLVRKNEGYGDSAMTPLRVFSRAPAAAGIRVRIDDKLSRIANQKEGQALDEDVEMDLIGYLVLLQVERQRREKGCSGAAEGGNGTPKLAIPASERPKAEALLRMPWEEVFTRIKAFANNHKYGMGEGARKIWGMPRGGAIVAGLMAALNPGQFKIVAEGRDADLIVDDIFDTGKTHAMLSLKYPVTPFWFLCHKGHEGIPDEQWVHFPWEKEEEAGR